MEREIFVVGLARTAIGTFGGSLKDVPNTQLATTVIKAAIERSGVAADMIGHVVMGNVIPTEVRDGSIRDCGSAAETRKNAGRFRIADRAFGHCVFRPLPHRNNDRG